MQIEHNIPVPPDRNIRHGLTEALRKCKVGDSFLLPTNPGNRTGAYVCAATLNMKVTIRKTSKGHRVWRIE